MSLGGYKFAGRFCQKGSLTDAQWALLVHKTRLSAFMAANTVSAAGWSFDQISGDISFGGYGNVIYSLDSVGNNYVSFVKHGTESPSYIAIITAFKWGTSTSTGQIDGPWQLKVGSGPYIGACNSLYHRISSVQLTTSNLFSSIAGASALIPCGFVMSVAQSYAGMTPTRSYSYPSQSAFYAGYAVKGGFVVSLVSNGVSDAQTHVSVFGVDAQTNVVPASNQYNYFATSLNGAYFGGSGASSYGDASDYNAEGNTPYAYGITCIPSSSGIPLISSISPTLYAQFLSTPISNEYPFSVIGLIADNEPDKNTIYKGGVAIDLIAANALPSKPTSRFGVYANGNYMLVSVKNSSTSLPYGTDGFTTYQTILNTSASCYPALYVGWDPTNPDITQASSWTEYTE